MVGNIKIVNNLDKNGNGGVNASDWYFLYEFFSDAGIGILSERGQGIYRLESIIHE
jgi:hypothetical protein